MTCNQDQNFAGPIWSSSIDVKTSNALQGLALLFGLGLQGCMGGAALGADHHQDAGADLVDAAGDLGGDGDGDAFGILSPGEQPRGDGDGDGDGIAEGDGDGDGDGDGPSCDCGQLQTPLQDADGAPLPRCTDDGGSLLQPAGYACGPAGCEPQTEATACAEGCIPRDDFFGLAARCR